VQCHGVAADKDVIKAVRVEKPQELLEVARSCWLRHTMSFV
jgi:hypothetical protein